MSATAAPRRFPIQRLLIWVPVFGVLIWLLPQPDPVIATRMLREECFRDLSRSWKSAVEGLNPPATTGEVIHSFFVGEDALPSKGEHRLPFFVGEVRDLTGIAPLWTRGRLLELLRHEKTGSSQFRVLESGDATDGGGRTPPRLDFEVKRSDDQVFLTVTDASTGAEPEFFLHPAAGDVESSSLGFTFSTSAPTPNWKALLPPMVAIFCALVTRRALLSLLLGALCGTTLLGTTVLRDRGVLGVTIDTFREQAVDGFHITIVLFVLALVGMIGVITRSGGIHGIVEWMTRRARGPRATRIVTAALGLVVFFDDYPNSVIVGSAMRPLTDRLKIAREKLAYLIDSTAAPVAGIALFSTWIAYEVTQYGQALAAIGSDREPYGLFLETIPLRFYCIYTLGFVFLSTIMNRDFGPMLEAEVRAATEGKVIRDGARPLTSRRFETMTPASGVVPRASRALVPLASVVLIMVVGFWLSGGGLVKWSELGWQSFSKESIKDILNGDYNMHAAVVAAIIGSLIAIAMALRPIGLKESLRAWTVGLSSLAVAVGILITAWVLANVCEQLQAGPYLVSTLGENLPLAYQPMIFFGLACVVAFATGTSWGTMAILLPISIPLVYAAEGELGPVTLLAFGAVLEGSIFGDHCSPISDTTVLSSVASGCDHLDHVRTQIPYALTCMAIAIVCGYLPIAFGIYGPWVAIPVGLIACGLVLRFVGREIPDPVVDV